MFEAQRTKSKKIRLSLAILLEFNKGKESNISLVFFCPYLREAMHYRKPGKWPGF
jgi:hypothetical protein